MVGRRSWAEGRWWRGGKRDYLAVVLLAILAVCVLQVVTWQQLSAPPLEQYYITTYRSNCVALRGMVLPYVLWPNGVRSLAVNHEVEPAQPSAQGSLPFKLS